MKKVAPNLLPHMTYLQEKELEEIPVRLLNIVKSSYGIRLDHELDHSNSTVLE
jgi:putative ATP-dependent endonuclease of the OLD family